MNYTYVPGYVGIKIQTTSSLAKTISILRKYNPVSIAEIKSKIEANDYVLLCLYTSHSGVRKIRKCYDELIMAGNIVALYEHDRLTSREFICNLINSHRQTEKEVLAQVEAEVAAESED